MTVKLHVGNPDPELVFRLKRRTARHGRSAEAECREILRQALADEGDLAFETLAAQLRQMTATHKQTPSEELLHEGHDEH